MCICVKQFALSAVGTVISGEASESDDESNIPLDLQTALQGMHCMLCDVWLLHTAYYIDLGTVSAISQHGRDCIEMTDDHFLWIVKSLICSMYELRFECQ